MKSIEKQKIEAAEPFIIEIIEYYGDEPEGFCVYHDINFLHASLYLYDRILPLLAGVKANKAIKEIYASLASMKNSIGMLTKSINNIPGLVSQINSIQYGESFCSFRKILLNESLSEEDKDLLLHDYAIGGKASTLEVCEISVEECSNRIESLKLLAKIIEDSNVRGGSQKKKGEAISEVKHLIKCYSAMRTEVIKIENLNNSYGNLWEAIVKYDDRLLGRHQPKYM